MRNFQAMAEYSSLRVLVVEDDPLLRWAIVETLSAGGHTVVEASDGATALQTVRETGEPFDAVLLDDCLPDTNALTVMASIRRWSPTSAIVLMLPFEKTDVASGARGLGVAAVLNKPFDLQVVNGFVSNAVGRPAVE
jgi:two-component system response regulator FlrC